MGIDNLNGVVEVYVMNRIEEAKKGAANLNLSFCNLVILPGPIFELTGLQVLNLQHNYLTALPEEIGGLTALTHLDLELNQLEKLPAAIGKLTNLRKLDLKNNRLRTLPPEIGQLTNLVELDLSSNQLTSLPREIAQLPNLKIIRLHGNPLEKPPLGVAIKGIEAIRDFFEYEDTGEDAAALSEKPVFEWNHEQNLRFEYHYQRMSGVIWPKFVEKQRQQNRVTEGHVWKDGMVLTHQRSQALIELGPSPPKIAIAIHGADKEETLSLIRRDLRSIHQSVGMHELREMIPCICNHCRHEPEVFHYEALKSFLANGQNETVCPKSGENVSVIAMVEEIDDLPVYWEDDIFEGWRPENLDHLKFIIYRGQVLVIHGPHQTSSKYSYEQLNQVIYEILKKKVHSDAELRNMIENLNLLKNRSADKNKRQIAVGLYKILISYLLNKGEHVLAGFLYESIRNLPYLV